MLSVKLVFIFLNYALHFQKVSYQLNKALSDSVDDSYQSDQFLGVKPNTIETLI